MPIIDKTLHPGELLFSEGEQDSSIYIIKQGKIELMTRNPLYLLEGNIKNPGDLLGVMTTLLGLPHVYSSRAVEKSTVARCDYKDFAGLIKTKPQIALKIVTGLSSVVRTLNQHIIRHLQDGEEQEDDRMFEIGLYFLEKKDLRKAEYVFKKCEEIHGMNKSIAEKTLFKLAEIYESMNEKDRALQTYQQLIDRYPLDKRITRVCQTIITRLKQECRPAQNSDEPDDVETPKPRKGLLALIKSAARENKE